jgi:hypothetical protein
LVRKASILGVNSWEDALGVLKPVRRIVTAARFLAAIIRTYLKIADCC